MILLSLKGDLMTNEQLLTLILSIGIPMLACFGWFFKQFNDLREEVNELRKEILEMKNDITEIKITLVKLEVRVEEKTLRVIEKSN